MIEMFELEETGHRNTFSTPLKMGTLNEVNEESSSSSSSSRSSEIKSD